jgi:hypothetical protein
MITGGQSGIGDDDASEAVGMLGSQSKPDQAAPILAD